MEGDYSRDTFDPIKHFSRVLMQQGRVQLDADWNEQASIFLHYLRALAVDLIGPHGGPADRLGFEITPRNQSDPLKLKDLTIGPGHYYVDGILCENEKRKELLSYYHQSDYPLEPERREGDKVPDTALLVYLDVRERHITYIEDDSIREVALGGADTAARARTVWQVKVKSLEKLLPAVPIAEITCGSHHLVDAMNKLTNSVQPFNQERMAARAQVPEDTDATNPCIVSPEAHYRGAENQLYRVEIHRSGHSWDGHTEGTKVSAATFKWSREDGAVVFPVQSLSGNTVILENLGRDDRFGLEVGDWVEIVDDNYVLRAESEPLLRVETVDRIDMRVTLSGAPTFGHDPTKHPLLRRWDQRAGGTGDLQLASDGAALMVGSTTQWLNLEDGVQVRFQKGQYRTGDYWLIPARTATGDIEWPGPKENPSALPPRGIEHHYAPLAVVYPELGSGFRVTDLRHSIAPIGSCCPKIEVLNPPSVSGPSATILFAVRVSGRNTDLKYRWSIMGGTITGADNTASITVAPTDKSTAVIAVVMIKGLPGGCPNSAMGACAIVNEPH